jgi:hypothetical protein
MLGVLAPSASPDSADVAALSNDDLFDAYEAQRREIRRREARSAVLLAEIERRRCFEPYGYLSAASYVAHRAGDSHRAAAGRVRTARALGDMPHTAAAFADGDIDPVRVRRLVDARDTAPESFPAAEERLVDQARRLDAKDFTSAVEMWRRRAVPRVIATEERERFERRRLSISDSFDGIVHLEGDLDPVSGEVVITAIRSVASPANRDNTDGRTPTQRRVDALTEICRAHLDSGVAPVSGGVKPHLDVIVDLDTLHQGATRRSEIGERGVLGPAAIEFFACDASVCRIVTDGPSKILDMVPPGPHRHPRPAPRPRHPRRRMRRPRLRPASLMVRCPPPHPLGRRRAHRHRRNVPRLPTPPHDDPPRHPPTRVIPPLPRKACLISPMRCGPVLRGVALGRHLGRTPCEDRCREGSITSVMDRLSGCAKLP